MRSREPAGWEREGGSSAESFAQAWAEGGPGGKTFGTVRGDAPRGRYPLTEPPFSAWSLSVGARPLPAFFI